MGSTLITVKAGNPAVGPILAVMANVTQKNLASVAFFSFYLGVFRASRCARSASKHFFYWFFIISTENKINFKFFLHLFMFFHTSIQSESIENDRKASEMIGFCLAPLGPTWLHLALLGSTWLHLALLGPTWLHLAPTWLLLGSTWLGLA